MVKIDYGSIVKEINDIRSTGTVWNRQQPRTAGR